MWSRGKRRKGAVLPAFISWLTSSVRSSGKPSMGGDGDMCVSVKCVCLIFHNVLGTDVCVCDEDYIKSLCEEVKIKRVCLPVSGEMRFFPAAWFSPGGFLS